MEVSVALKIIYIYVRVHQGVHTRTYVCVLGGRKCSLFEKFGVLCFLVTPVLRFALLPYYRWYVYEYWMILWYIISFKNLLLLCL